MMYAVTAAAALLLAPQALAFKVPTCGDEGHICCDSKFYINAAVPGDCAGGLACIKGICLPGPDPVPVLCGLFKLPVCTEDGVSPCATGLVPDAGICTEPVPVPPPECGGDGEICCPGDSCDLHSLACFGGTCVPCGKLGLPACTEDGISPCDAGLVVDGAGFCVKPKPTPTPVPSPKKDDDEEGDDGDEGDEGIGMKEGDDEGDDGDEGDEGTGGMKEGDDDDDEGNDGDEGDEGTGGMKDGDDDEGGYDEGGMVDGKKEGDDEGDEDEGDDDEGDDGKISTDGKKKIYFF